MKKINPRAPNGRYIYVSSVFFTQNVLFHNLSTETYNLPLKALTVYQKRIMHTG